ncbi:MAG: hypothetical protein KKA84_05400 [Bacteroidetes bacterium]|nr:hypothetical protein [Bacteroidota bacterium]
MQKNLFAVVVLVVSFLLSTTLVQAQSQGLAETLGNLSSTAGAAYVAPIVTSFGSNLNSGWFSGAPKATKLGFDIKLRIIGVGSFFTDDQKVLSTSGLFSFTDDQMDLLLQNAAGLTPGSQEFSTLKSYMQANNNWEVHFSGPTIIGDGDTPLHITFPGQVINGENFTEYDLIMEDVKGYLNELPVLPSVAAQIDIGTFMGTQASFRWFPEMDVQDLGKFKFFGFGILHNPEVWFNDPLPIDLGIGFFTQTMEVGSIFKSTATQYGVYASKTFGAGISITPYVGLTMETSNTEVAYDYAFSGPGGITETARIGFELEGENKAGVTLGASINLLFINLSVDYKMAKTKTVSGAISFGL